MQFSNLCTLKGAIDDGIFIAMLFYRVTENRMYKTVVKLMWAITHSKMNTMFDVVVYSNLCFSENISIALLESHIN